MFGICDFFKRIFGSFSYPQATEDTNYSFKNDFRNQEDCKEGFPYKTGFIFYLDILGCRGISLKSKGDKDALTKVKKIVEIFREIEQQYEDKHWGNYYYMPFTREGYTADKSLREENIKVTLSLFSDSIIISYTPEIANRFVIWYKQMYQIFNDICRTIYLFACNGIFLRGGMSYGKFYHCGNVCYGPALLEAVRLESEICYPTIAICDSFRERIDEDLKSTEIDNYCPGYKTPHELKTFAEDFFGIYLDLTCVNGQTKMILDWMVAIFYDHSNRVDVMKKVITEEMNMNYPERIKEKYIWLAKRFNHSLGYPSIYSYRSYIEKQIEVYPKSRTQGK